MKEALSSSECRFLQDPHGVTSQKAPFFIVTGVKTSNLTKLIYFLEGYQRFGGKYLFHFHGRRTNDTNRKAEGTPHDESNSYMAPKRS
jgi:hypothetical protein